MIAVDTNILVYAHREDSEFHRVALECVVGLAEGFNRWTIPWPCVHEFLAIVTHPRIYRPPTPIEIAFASIEVWLGSPHCQPIGEGTEYLDNLRRLAITGKIKGPMIHDARIAAICVYNGVTELLTADRDFSRYRNVKTRNPLLG